MAVAIETKSGSVSPAMSNCPQHGFTAEFVEAIGGINE
jgi:putative hemolysin